MEFSWFLSVESVDIFENPYFDLITAYNIIGPITFFINVFGILIIHFKAPRQLRNYVNNLLCNLLLGLIFELFWTVFTCPQINPPLVMGSAHGIFTKWLNMAPFTQLLITMPILHASSCSVAQLILFRANSVLLPGSRLKISGKQLNIFIIIFYALNILQSFGFIFLLGTKQNGAQLAKDYIDSHPEYPSLRKSYNSSMMEAFDVYGVMQYVIMGTFGVITTGLCVLGYCTIVGTLIFQTTTSARSRLNVRKILITLTIQVSPSFCCYAFSAAWLGCCMGLNIRLPFSQTISDLSCLVFGLHNALSVLIALSLMRVYREFLLTPFKNTPIIFCINSFGILVVLTKTPPQMRDYSRALLCHLMIGTLFEVLLTVMVCPRMYTPECMGSTHGLFTKWLQIDVFYQEFLALTLMDLMGCTVTHLILFRANSVLPPGFKYKLKKRQLKYLLIFLYTANILPTIFVNILVRINQNGMENGKHFVETHSEFPSLLPFYNMIYLETDDIWRALHYWVYLSGVTWVGWVGCFGFMLIVGQLFSHSIRSKNSKLNIKWILFSLTIQISPSLLCYTIACMWFAYSISFGVDWEYNQIFNDLICLNMSFHNPLSIIIALLLNKSYRDFVFSPFKTENGCLWVKRRKTSQSIVSVTTSFHVNAMKPRKRSSTFN